MPDPRQDTAKADYPTVCEVCGKKSAYPSLVATDGADHVRIDLCCRACGAAWSERRESWPLFRPLDKR